MVTSFHATAVLAVLAVLATATPTHGQGSLTPPPGPPTPTMKSLDQVEARLIVNATNTPGDGANTFIISAPGSYYFTGNITGELDKHGISIQTNDVTLDLNGFALVSGGGASLRGVDTPALITNLTIRNGSVRGWTDGGVWAGSAVAQVEDLRLSGNTGATGLTVGNGSIVQDCVASGNATGFFLPDRSQASRCIATINTGVGFDCTAYVNLIDCTSSRNGSHGIVTLGGTSLTRCSSTRNLPSGRGISAGPGCTIAACTTSNNGAEGVRTDTGCTITDSIAHSNGAAGIYTTLSTVSQCAATSNLGFGISAEGSAIRSSTANHNTSTGINAGAGSTVVDCTAGSNVINGVTLTTGGTVRNCTVRANSQIGIEVKGSCQVTGNTCEANRTGILVTEHHNRVDGNHCSVDFAAGICFHIKGQNNVVVRNTARGPRHPFPGLPGGIVANTYVFDSPANNSSGPVHGSASGEIPADASPWTNFQNF